MSTVDPDLREYFDTASNLPDVVGTGMPAERPPARLLPGIAFGLALWVGASVCWAQAPQQAPPPAPAIAGTPVNVPIRLGGRDVIYLMVDVGGMPAAERARRVEVVLNQVVADRALTNLSIRLEEIDNVTRLMIGTYALVAVTEPDAAAIGMSRALVAQVWARELENAIRSERALYSPDALLRSALRSLAATLLLLLLLWAWHRVGASLQALIKRQLDRRLDALRTGRVSHRSAQSFTLLVEQTVKAVRLLGFVLLLQSYFTFVLSLFPWTRFIGNTLFSMVINPLLTVWRAFVDYLPNAFFLFFIGLLTLYISRFVNILFDSIADERISIPGFSADWAEPTFKALRAVILAFALVAAFPYLPGSGSPALAGVSLLAGVLLSLAASSSLSNMVAGLVLTYSGAFRMGDHVQVGGTVGDVVERGLLATRVRTRKNEDVIVPNSVVLAGHIINYSAIAATDGLILHTRITIAYTAPWRQVHALLVAAARSTTGVLDTPEPFVLQASLMDFYITYEINAYVSDVRSIPRIYSELHANIQDRFNDAGVEIMSPHVTSVRDGNAIAIPDAVRPAGYEAPSFRIKLAGPPTSAGRVDHRRRAERT